jgi:hypothetical protein
VSESWVAKASIFSGRPDPTWSIVESVAKDLEAVWKSLTPVSERPRESADLGYRGCFLTDREGRTWHAHRGMVTLTVGHASESRRDPEKTFESKLLASAPVGLLPHKLIDEGLGRSWDGKPEC